VSADPGVAIVSCDDALAAALDDDGAVVLSAHAHVRACGRCRHALRGHRTLRDGLRRLGGAPAPGEPPRADDEMVAAILAGLDLADRRAARRVRWSVAGAVAGAVAGGVTAGVVAVARGRRPVAV
jgi:hypothetical protein